MNSYNSKVNLPLKYEEACNEFLKVFDVRFKIESLSNVNLLSRYHRDVDK